MGRAFLPPGESETCRKNSGTMRSMGEGPRRECRFGGQPPPSRFGARHLRVPGRNPVADQATASANARRPVRPGCAAVPKGQP